MTQDLIMERSMGKMDDLFDASDAHELCGACGGTGRVYEGERCRFCEDVDTDTKHRLLADCDELREIAAWLDSLGKRDNAAFLRRFATRIEGCKSFLKQDNAKLTGGGAND